MPIELRSELVDLRRQILSMAALVEQRLNIVIDAVVRLDFDAAMQVRHGDKQVDEMELRIEEACLRVLALTQPVASDLRFVLSVLRINSDLERVGDLVKNIAKRVIDLQSAPHVELPEALAKIAMSVRDMFSRAMKALADNDAEECRRIRMSDRRVDDLQKEIFAWAHQEIPAHVESTRGAIDILSMTRAIERIGDYATNIAEDIIFLVEGTIIRHGHQRKALLGKDESAG